MQKLVQSDHGDPGSRERAAGFTQPFISSTLNDLATSQQASTQQSPARTSPFKRMSLKDIYFLNEYSKSISKAQARLCCQVLVTSSESRCED